MKTYKHLYAQIGTFENLSRAFYQARRGKPKTPEMCAFEFNLEENLFALQAELETQTYQPSGYRHFYIYEPKKRLVSAAPFRDRVAQHALCNIIEPIFEKRFIEDSYACRVGKGTHRALARAQEFLRKHEYVFHGDILKFFASVDHPILLGMLERRLQDAQVMTLIRKILASGDGVLADEYPMQWFPGDDLLSPLARARGLPIGNLTSQFWANLYLHELDLFVKHTLRCHAYVRYMDDFLLFSHDKAELHHWRGEVARFLQTVRLSLHPRKQRIYPVCTGVDFVGFVSFPHRVKIRRDSVRRLTQRLREFQRQFSAGEITLTQIEQSLQSWVAHSRYADSFQLRRQIISRYVWRPPTSETLARDFGSLRARHE